MSSPTIVAEVGDRPTEGYAILVAVGNPEHAAQLLRTAADIARGEGGSIHVVSVVAKAQDSPFGVFADETIGEEFAAGSRRALERSVDAGRDLAVDVSGRVVVDQSVSQGVLATAGEIDADGILIGWSDGTRRSDAVLGTNVDAIVERAPQDVYVERIGTTADGVDRVLVPVAGGPHATLAAEAGYAIAAANDSTLTLLSVAAEGADRTDARERIEATREELALAAASAGGDGGTVDDAGFVDGGATYAREMGSDGDVDVETSVSTNDDVVDAIATAAGDHDVVLMGATRSGPHRARLVGSIPRTVTDRTDRTVVLARTWTGGSRLTRLLTKIRWS